MLSFGVLTGRGTVLRLFRLSTTKTSFGCVWFLRTPPPCDVQRQRAAQQDDQDQGFNRALGPDSDRGSDRIRVNRLRVFSWAVSLKTCITAGLFRSSH